MFIIPKLPSHVSKSVASKQRGHLYLPSCVAIDITLWQVSYVAGRLLFDFTNEGISDIFKNIYIFVIEFLKMNWLCFQTILIMHINESKLITLIHHPLWTPSHLCLYSPFPTNPTLAFNFSVLWTAKFYQDWLCGLSIIYSSLVVSAMGIQLKTRTFSSKNWSVDISLARRETGSHETILYPHQITGCSVQAQSR